MHTDYSARPLPAPQGRTQQGQLQAPQGNKSDLFQNQNTSGGGGQLSNEVFLQLLALIIKLIQTLIGSQQNPSDDTGNRTSNSSSPQAASDGAKGDDGSPNSVVSAPALPDSAPNNSINPDRDSSNDGSDSISSKQIFNTPVGENEPGPATPGKAYETTFTAKPGENLSFATMLVQSNDLFFAPSEEGIPLFDEQGKPLEGDVTDKLEIWDAGTELNEVAGEGANQAPRQSGANNGAADPDNRVRALDPTDAGLPEVNEQIKANIEYLGNNEFKLTLNNISASSDLATPIAPGVAVVHSEPAPLFSNLQADRGLGLEALAEDGNPAALFGNL